MITYFESKKTQLDVLATALDETLGPAFVGAEQVQGSHDVQEHSLGEEVRDAVRRQTRDTLDVLDELPVTSTDDLADLRVVRRRVGLHLGTEIGRIGA